MKRGGQAAASYKPSTLVDKNRFILGQYVHPSSETIAIEPMLEQAEKIIQKPVTQLLLDGGYLCERVLTLCISKHINVLIPTLRKYSAVRQPSHKNEFRYDPLLDHYQCPGGQYLTPIERYKGNQHYLPYVRYGGADCRGCPFFGTCTKSEKGRMIKRFESDEAKEILSELMKNPRAQADYQKRQAWVEPVFGELRDIQGLHRFRRKGLKNVRLEFSLHAMAHNLRRMIKVMGPSKTALYIAFFSSFCALWMFISRFIAYPRFSREFQFYRRIYA